MDACPPFNIPPFVPSFNSCLRRHSRWTFCKYGSINTVYRIFFCTLVAGWAQSVGPICAATGGLFLFHHHSMGDSGNTTLNAIHVEETSPIIRIKQAAKQVNGQHIEILLMGYADRIFIHVTMEGKVGHIVPAELLPHSNTTRSPFPLRTHCLPRISPTKMKRG